MREDLRESESWPLLGGGRKGEPASAFRPSWKLSSLLFSIGLGAALVGYYLSYGGLAAVLPMEQSAAPAGADEDLFDFIVVGAGPAGSILSRRLVNKGYDVLLLEAGRPMQYDVGGAILGGDYFGGPITRFDIPLLWHVGVDAHPDYIWQGFDVPHVTVGKGVGGSAALDAMIYVRCTPADMAAWNTTGWSWEDALEAYLALEDFPSPAGGTPGYHGDSGAGAIPRDEARPDHNAANPMRRLAEDTAPDAVSTLNSFFKIRTAAPGIVDRIATSFVDAAVSYGLAPTPDFNDPDGGRAGAGLYSFNIRDGIRDSAAVRMLSPLLFKGGRRSAGIDYGGEVAAGPHEAIQKYQSYINGESDKVYGEGVGRFKLLTNAEVTKVMFSSTSDTEESAAPGASTGAPPGRGVGLGGGGSLRVDKASLTGHIGANGTSLKLSGSLTAKGGGGGGAAGGGGGGGSGEGGGGGGGDAQNAAIQGGEDGIGFGGGGNVKDKGKLAITTSPGAGIDISFSGSVRASGGGGGGTRGGGGGGGGPGGGGGGGDAHPNSSDSSAHRSLGSTLVGDPSHSQNAIGVEYWSDGVLKKAFLRQSQAAGGCGVGGVALTAGALMTPKLLMNSGIGRSDVLEKSRIPIIVHSPQVGRHLKDHPAVGVVVLASPVLFSDTTSAFEMSMNWGRYVESVMSSRSPTGHPTAEYGIVGTPGISAGAFLTSPHCRSGQPDIQLTIFPKTPSWNRKVGEDDRRMLQITVALLSPDGEREVVLNSTTPVFSCPLLRVPGNMSEREYLSDVDIAKLSWGVEQARNILKTAPLSVDLSSAEISPGKDVLSDTASMRNWIRSNVYIYSHWVGTARMGDDVSSSSDVDAASIASSAVDPKLRVRGTKNVFVADASVMPSIPNGNVHSTVTMIGYRAADLISKNRTKW